jgi:hypothetical protein
MNRLFHFGLLLVMLTFAAAAQSQSLHGTAKTTATERRLIASALYLASDLSDSFAYQYSGGRGGTATGIQLFDTSIYFKSVTSVNPVQRLIKAYDAADRTQWVVYQSWESTGSWENKMRFAFTYDGAGDTLTQLTQVWDASSLVWTNSACDSSDYTSGLRQSRNRTVWNNTTAAWRPSERWLYTYSGASLSNSLHQLYVAPGWNDESRISYAYDGAGLLTTQTSERYTGGAWVNTALKLYTYDAADLPLSVLEQQWVSGAWLNYRETLTEYNADALPVTIYTRAWMSPTDIDTYQRADLVYTSDKLLATQTLNNWDGVSPGLPNINTRYYYYEDYSTVIPETGATALSMALFPVPADKQLNIAIALPAAQTLSLQLCDLRGRSWRQEELAVPSGNSRQTLDVSALAPGVYVLHMRTATGNDYAKTFIVQR